MNGNSYSDFTKIYSEADQSVRSAIKHYSEWLKFARNKQVTPRGEWNVWLILAGRGWGKTRTGAEDVFRFAMQNPESRCGIVAPTTKDLRRVCFEGVSGIMSIIPDDCFMVDRAKSYNKTIHEIELWNGSVIQGYSASEPDRLRGPQFHRIWADELAAWQYEDAYDQMMFGLRLGKLPQLVVTTTPRPTPIIKKLFDRREKDVVLTQGSTFENEENLSKSALDNMRERYEGTRLGRQELYAEILDDVEGALWTYSMIDRSRCRKTEVPDLRQIVVAIDPAVTSNEDSDETGIVVAGICEKKHFYILDDVSGIMTPEEWGRLAIMTLDKYAGDRIIAEVNNGGDLVLRLLRNIDYDVPYVAVRATRGKIIRAEPISALYEQDRVHHVGSLKKLEDQMCNWTPLLNQKSPDRMDALVWALTYLSKYQSEPRIRIH